MLLILAVYVALIFASAVIYVVSPTIGFYLLQISIALLIVYLTYATSLYVVRGDMIIHGGFVPQYSKTLILEGFQNSATISSTVINTINPSAGNYAMLPRSINQLGGAEFTYQFWINISNTTPTNVGYKDILVRGDISTYNLMTVDSKTQQVTSSVDDVIIKCPRIRFNGTYDSLAVEINTVTNPNPPPIIISSTNSKAQSSNVLSFISNKWVLYTFVFQDRFRVNEFEDGIQMQFYIGDFLYQTSSMDGALRQNNGNLYLFPNGSVQGCLIGNLAYYNYALGVDDISKTVAAGPPITYVKSTTSAIAQPLYLTEYNKLDLYKS